MLAEKNAEHTGRASARETETTTGAMALGSTADEAVCALRRFLHAFAAAQFREGGAGAVPDELVRTAAQLLQEVASFAQIDEPDAAHHGLRRDLRQVRPLGCLTSREKTVAVLAARGYTNREIADELFLSAKTVEYHLTNVYQKLHVKSRRELRRLLGLPR
jgi:DNA-binding NarL/FixJ family response regulator